MWLKFGAPVYSLSKYASFSSGNRGSAASDPRESDHVTHSDCSFGSIPTSSKMSSGVIPDRLRRSNSGAS